MAHIYRCLQCGQPTQGPDEDIVCDACLAELERYLRDEEKSRPTPVDLNGFGARRRETPSEEAVNGRLRKLLDDW